MTFCWTRPFHRSFPAQVGNFEEAARHARHCCALKPDWGWGHYRLGCAYFHLGKVQEAASALGLAASLDEGNAQGRKSVRHWPTSRAPISVVFHSFWLIFGRVSISRNGLERECLSLERAPAEHPR